MSYEVVGAQILQTGILCFMFSAFGINGSFGVLCWNVISANGYRDPQLPYTPKLGLLLNAMKRMLDILHPKIEFNLKSWGSCCIPDGGNVAAGERLSDVAFMLRSKKRY
ncbi:hypothetical protein Tco_0914016 [Tanacetum coccineum]